MMSKNVYFTQKLHILKGKTMTARKLGAEFEERACQFLTAQNLTIIATNYTAHGLGEIDIIALQDIVQKNGTIRQTLVFVEVKMRKQSQFAQAIESITPKKQRRIINTALHFLQNHACYADLDCRFDVIAFEMDEWQIVSYEWIQGAFLMA